MYPGATRGSPTTCSRLQRLRVNEESAGLAEIIEGQQILGDAALGLLGVTLAGLSSGVAFAVVAQRTKEQTEAGEAEFIQNQKNTLDIYLSRRADMKAGAPVAAASATCANMWPSSTA